MRVPRRIANIGRRRYDYINSQRGQIADSALRLQDNLLRTIISEIVPLLAVEGGVIKDTVANYRLLSTLDRVYDDFTEVTKRVFLPQFNAFSSNIENLTEQTFRAAGVDWQARFDRVLESTTRKMNLRMGVVGGNIVGGGFLDNVFKNTLFETELKEYMVKGITGQMEMSKFAEGLNRIVTGAGEVQGGIEKQMDRFVYDSYQQYDRAYNLSLADDFDMNYFIYLGGLIDDSRDFCREHNNRVWSREEAEQWPNWRPADAMFISDFKQKDIYSVPSYIDYAGYQPLIDAGGYNCRHRLSWISDELAFRMRPELAEATL